MDPDILQLARERVANGTLPRVTRFRTFGGPGSGCACALCGTTIPAASLEILVEAEDEPLTLVFHVKCQAAWQVATAD